MGLNIIFMGTPDFAVPALTALIESHHTVIAVYTQPPRPAGRGMNLKKSPVHVLAEKNRIPVFTPKNFKNPEDVKAFQNLKADLAVVAAYGLLLPESILNAPKMGCINIHASLLPRWRGAAPIQAAILAGDKSSGNTIMQMEKGLDSGPILFQDPFDLAPDETGGSLHDKLALQGGDIIVGVVDALAAGTLRPKIQNEADVTFAPKINKEDAAIDWQKGATFIDRQVRAFNPYPGAFFVFKGRRYRILKGKVEAGKGAAGEILDDRLLVGTGNDAYRILVIQKEGKTPMTADEFLHGQTLPKGTTLS